MTKKVTVTKTTVVTKVEAQRKAAVPANPKSKPAEGPSKRLRLFTLLAKCPNPHGMTAATIRKKLQTSSICAILKAECMADQPRIRRYVPEEGQERHGYSFGLTARGRKALDKGTVDQDAPSSATVYGTAALSWSAKNR